MRRFVLILLFMCAMAGGLFAQDEFRGQLRLNFHDFMKFGWDATSFEKAAVDFEFGFSPSLSFGTSLYFFYLESTSLYGVGGSLFLRYYLDSYQAENDSRLHPSGLYFGLHPINALVLYSSNTTLTKVRWDVAAEMGIQSPFLYPFGSAVFLKIIDYDVLGSNVVFFNLGISLTLDF